MLWILLSIFRSILVVLKILFIRYDNTPYLMFPFIVNIIAGSISLTYFTLYYKEHFTTEFSKPEVYIYSLVVLFGNLLAFYIIKTSTNPAYFKVFVSLQIILLFIITLYISDKSEVSAQSMAGLVFGCLAIILISLDKANH
jgi:drug/metabolite transporter (DMT)-like permease